MSGDKGAGQGAGDEGADQRAGMRGGGRSDQGAGPEGDNGGGMSSASIWARDLGMGTRFAVTGGRRNVLRTVLTALGVGVGVVVLLLAAALPNMAEGRQARGEALLGAEHGKGGPALLMGRADTEFRDFSGEKEISGAVMRPEGKGAGKGVPTPPGADRVPGPGEMLVSPELKKLLDSDDGKELGKRLDARVVGTIGQDGLEGPASMAYYKGVASLDAGRDDVERVTAFHEPEGAGGGIDFGTGSAGAMLVLMTALACVVLTLPVAVFIGAAARFGGEARDARLAALRLVGADAATVRRVAAGESMAGALGGLAVGGALFAVLRVVGERVRVGGLSWFTSDITPVPLLALLVVVAVPVIAVVATLVAMRAVAVTPSGVVRETGRPRRRFLWRLAFPVLGVLVLVAQGAMNGGMSTNVNMLPVVAGIVLVLVGVVLLLPWVVELALGRLRGAGPLSWQLAVRRLQLNSGTASRAVAGIAVAVAGAIALQLFFTGTSAREEQQAQSRDRTALSVFDISGRATEGQVGSLRKQLGDMDGVKDSAVYRHVAARKGKGDGVDDVAMLNIADCGTLKKLARVDDCRDGQVFRVGNDEVGAEPPGTRLTLAGGAHWTVPESARTVDARPSPTHEPVNGVLATPGAFGDTKVKGADMAAWIRMPVDDPKTVEQVRTAFFKADPAYGVTQQRPSAVAREHLSVESALFTGACVLLALLGASLVLSTVDQLRERKRQLAVVSACGARRTTLALSLLWQAMVPMALGLALAVGFGVGLGWMLLWGLGARVVNWFEFVPVVGVGAGMTVLVTLLTLPALWRVTRPDGLRTE
ncbi:FtsX-like permease family protein [Streptomyces sp. ODS28]|uniref:FtsX-like permease family protein n=1 Tax=Streptomyces sp. ODS28 TaxID=3136688 RepID=UPI0031EC21EF